MRWIAPKQDCVDGAPDTVSPTTRAEPVRLPRDIHGLDTALGLKRVLGKEATYLHMLRKFVSGQRDAMALVEWALAEDDWPGAERVAHTLKGVAGNVGATQVQAHAAALEEALRMRAPPDTVQALTQTADASLTALLAALQQQLPEEEQVQASNADAGRLSELVSELKALLQADDSAALDLFGEHAALLKFAYPAQFQSLESAMEGYDFSRALEYL